MVPLLLFVSFSISKFPRRANHTTVIITRVTHTAEVMLDMLYNHNKVANLDFCQAH